MSDRTRRPNGTESPAAVTIESAPVIVTGPGLPQRVEMSQPGDPTSYAATAPENNIMLHGYRELTERQASQLRNVKDLGLALWNELHMIDESSADDTAFVSRELAYAAKALEEAIMWAEKFFNL